MAKPVGKSRKKKKTKNKIVQKIFLPGGNKRKETKKYPKVLNMQNFFVFWSHTIRLSYMNIMAYRMKYMLLFNRERCVLFRVLLAFLYVFSSSTQFVIGT